MEISKIKKVVFLLESISQPRCIKRINSFISNGIKVKVYGIDRGKYNLNAKINGVEFIVFDKQKDQGGYFSKLFKNLISVKKILNENKEHVTIFYSFGFSLTFALWINGCNRYVYEISDIVYGYKRFNYFRFLFRFLDEKIINKSIHTVVTSVGFSSYLFKNKTAKNIHFQPNKLDYLFHQKRRPEKKINLDTTKLRFSFVGAFNSPNTIFRFARIVGEQFQNHSFVFFGDSLLTEEVVKLTQRFPNVIFKGPFKNPDNLEEIYNKIDVVIACYDNQFLNERIVEPNKLYEALYFKKPIIVSENTFLAERVKKLGCGFAINASEDNSIISFLNSLCSEDLTTIYDNIEKVPLSDIIDDNSQDLIAKLGILEEKYN